MSKATLVVMAAGMATRYGGNKQIEGMGPHGEILMEYSIRDAIRAGFAKVVFIIKPEMKQKMQQICGDRFASEIEVCYAFQDYSSIPACYVIPQERVKPLGTVHAVLCAREFIGEPFAVINADDYYGVEPFARMYEFLTSLNDDGQAAMMGYQLKNTVSKHGTVTRGICSVENGMLVGVKETQQIRLCEDGSILETSDSSGPVPLNPDSLTSMNFWGFAPGVFELLEREFVHFLSEIPQGDMKTEYLLPVFVDQMLHRGELRVRVLETTASWFGVTYKEDKPKVVAALKALHDSGVYA